MSDEEFSTLVDGMNIEELKDEARRRGHSEDDINKMMAKGAKWNEAYKEKEIEDQNKDFKFKGTVDGVYDPNSTRKGLINEYKSRSGLTSGTESYEVVDVDFSNKNTAMEFTCNCGAKVSEADLSQHMKDMHGSKLGETRYKTYKTEHNLFITENDSNAKDTAVEGLYEQYIERYGESESWRLGGGFGEALRNDDLKDAWQRADLGNRDRLLELSGLTKEDLEVIAYGDESMKMDGYEMEDFYSSEEDEDDVKVSLNVNDGTLSDVPIEESKAREVTQNQIDNKWQQYYKARDKVDNFDWDRGTDSQINNLEREADKIGADAEKLEDEYNKQEYGQRIKSK